MGKSYRLRQKILLKQGHITQELHDARCEQYRLMRSLKKQHATKDACCDKAEPGNGGAE